MLKVLEGGKNGNGKQQEGLAISLDELAREGARRMIAAALSVEVEDYVGRYAGERDERGHALVVRNGAARPRPVTLGAGTIEVQAPRVNDKRVVDGKRQRFTSRILPPYMRRSPKVDAVLPLLYLHGLSTGDFQEALPTLLGDDAAGLSPSAITRLTHVWREEHAAWNKRSLADRDYVYVWADGVHFNIRLEEDRLAALVVVGVRPDGTKEVVAIEDGYRESTESWLTLLRDLRARGMRAPVLSVGDGALGFWAALRQVWPATREQRCWFHKLGNVLDKLPRRLQPQAKRMLHEALYAATKSDAQKAIARFADEYGAKYPKAVECLTQDQDALLAFFDFPADHWKHLRTTNPIESAFSTVKLRSRVTRGAGSRAAGLTMTYKLLRAAEATWRRLDGQELIPLVRAGIRFVDGKQQERDNEDINNEGMKKVRKAAA
ncbi:MAG TPA: IS256 family transposase [Polyangia bacterium]|nr:IS256 family transposase [Polyangia bacterium]